MTTTVKTLINQGVDFYVGDFGTYRITHFQKEQGGEWLESHSYVEGDDMFAIRTVDGDEFLTGEA